MNSINIFIAGDSTAANKAEEKRPESGWGEALGQFFNQEVEIRNHAMNGRSSKSFIDEGRLDAIIEEIGEGDYLFIQFGHNDEKEDPERHTDPQTSYKEHLSRYVESVRRKDAFPVLLTSIQRRSFNEVGEIINTHGEYPEAMRELAKALEVPLLDLGEASRVFFNALGVEKSKEILLWLKPGENLNYPDGVQDNTHFCQRGAVEIAGLVVEEIRKCVGLQELAKKLNPSS